MGTILQKLLPLGELLETIKRFPLSVLCAFALFVLSIMVVHDFIDDEDEFVRVFAILGCLYFWFGISKLIAESNKWSLVKYIAISAVIGIAIAVLIGFSDLWYMHLMFVVPALLLGIMFAPYLTSGDDISFWFFNRTMWFGVVVSYAALIMFAGGLSLALVAIQTLFDVDIDDKIYFDIWLFAAFVLGPLYALSWVPKRFEYSDDDCQDPTGLRFIANWISAPMVLVYLLILYAYFIKIIMSGEVPNGYLSYMISGFAGAGIVAYLVAHPLRNEGSLQLKLFYKIFFPALIIPVGFNFYAIWERVSAYGITEQRYLVMLSAMWFAILALGNIRGKIPIKAIPMTLAMLLVFASFGPWGGVSLSGISQFSRLEALLTKNELLVDDKIVKSEGEISFDDRLSISSILDYICSTERYAKIEPWFNTENKGGFKCWSGRGLTEQLGFKHVSRYYRKRNDDVFNMRSYPLHVYDVGGYDFFFKNRYIYAGNESSIVTPDNIFDNDSEIDLHLTKQGFVKLEINDDVIFNYDLKKFIIKNKESQGKSKSLILDIDNEKISARLYFTNINGQMEGDIPVINNISLDFAFRLKE